MREVIVHNASTNPAIPFPKSVEQYRGYLIGWGVATEVSDGIAETDTHAIVEREDGSVAMVFPTRIKFVEPYATTAKLAATPAGIARACGMENEVERAAEVSATNPPKGFERIFQGPRKPGYLYWSKEGFWDNGHQNNFGVPVGFFDIPCANPIEVAP